MSVGRVVNDRADYVEHTLEHYQQRFNWDCGVSCVLMLLPAAQREELLQNFDKICAEEGFGHSTWTIDLCFLLKRFGVKHSMYSTLLGVNDDYMQQGYYEKIIPMDKERILRRFSEAPSAGISAEQRSLSDEELATHLRTNGPAIVLIDAGVLVCDLCKHNMLKAEIRRWFGGSYRGHYVVVVGWSGGRVLFHDPALSPRVCGTSVPRFTAARRATGTDEDTILVYNHYR